MNHKPRTLLGRPCGAACLFTLLARLALLPLVPVTGATFTWNGSGADDDWTTDQNWVGNVAPLPLGFTNIVMEGAAGTTPNVDVPFSINSLTFFPSAFAFTLGGSELRISTGPVNGVKSIKNLSTFAQTINNDIMLLAPQKWVVDSFSGALNINGDVDLNSQSLTLEGRGDALTLSGSITGFGSLDIPLFSDAQLIGSTANTFTGPTTTSGDLFLSKSITNGAIPGDLLILNTMGVIARAILESNDQISEASNNEVAINGGLFNLNGFSDAIQNLTMTAGDVTTGAGTLGILGDVTTNADASQATITGNLDLEGGTRTFNIANGSASPDLLVDGVISNGSLIMNGSGTMVFRGASANTYTGLTTVDSGTLELDKTPTDGAIRGNLTIGNGSDAPATAIVQLLQDDQILGNLGKVVTINGSGLLDLRRQSDRIFDLNMTGGMVRIGTSATGGTLTLLGNVTTNASDATATISRGASGAKLDLNGRVVTFNIANGNAATDMSISVVVDNGGLTKTGAGTLQLDERGLYTGTTTVNEGTLALSVNSLAGATRVMGSASITSSQTIDIQGGRLEGDGTYNANISLSNTLGTAVLAPGTSIGTIDSGDLTLGTGAVYEWESDGVLSDLVNVNGILSFAGDATLRVVDTDGSPDPNANYPLFTYTPTASDPANANWTIDGSQASSWDLSAAAVSVDSAADQVVLSGLADHCAWVNPGDGAWDAGPNWSAASRPWPTARSRSRRRTA